MALAGTSHDISLVDTIEVPFICDRDKNGNPIYSEGMAAPLNVLQNAGLSEDALNPDRNFPVAYQTSGVGGFGQEFYNTGEPRRYLSSYGCDLSNDGVATIGPLYTSVAWPTVTAYSDLTDAGLETWTSATVLTNWTTVKGGTSTGSLSRNTANVKEGTYAAALSGGGTGNDDIYIKQSISAWNNEYRGKRFIFTAWIKPDTSVLAVRIYDGIGRTSVNSSSGTGVYEAVTVSRVLDVAATECTVEIYCGDASGGIADVTSFRGYTKGTNTIFAEFGGKEYMASGAILFNKTTAATSWSYAADYGCTITSLKVGDVSGTQYLFVCTSAFTSSATATDTIHNKMWYWNGTTSTQASGTNAQGDYLAVVSGTFYLADTPNTVRTQTSPLSGNFSTSYTIGSAERNITSLVVAGGVCYIIKEDGIYHITAAGAVVEDAPALSGYYSSGAGRNAVEHNGDIFAPMGTALVFYDVSAGTWDNISPTRTVASRGPVDTTATGYSVSAMMLRQQTDFDGEIITLASSPEHLWVLQSSTSGKTMLYKGQFAVVDGTAAWRWHPVANTTLSVTAGGIHALAYSVISGSARVWTGNQTSNPGYYDLTKYQTGAGPYYVTPWYTGGVRQIQKAIYTLTLGLQTISNAHYYVTVSYQKYGESSFTSFGTYDTTVTTGEQSVYAPANFNSVAVRFKIAMQTDDSSYSPQVNYLKANGKIRNTEIPVIQATVMCCDNGLTRRGTRDGFKASRKVTAINTVLASNWPVGAYNIDGTAIVVDMISRELVGVFYEGNKRGSIYSIVLQKVTLS